MGSGGATPLKLALAGTAASAVLTSLVSAVLIPRAQVMDQFRFWQVGSTGGATLASVLTCLPFLASGIITAFILSPALNAISLGDDMATGLGVNVKAVRLIATAASVVLCGTITALAGPIGFAGLMAPHMMRLLFGADQKVVIPMSAISGAVLLTLADIIGRVVGRPSELEVGIVTAFIGAPVLIILAMRSKNSL